MPDVALVAAISPFSVRTVCGPGFDDPQPFEVSWYGHEYANYLGSRFTVLFKSGIALTIRDRENKVWVAFVDAWVKGWPHSGGWVCPSCVVLAPKPIGILSFDVRRLSTSMCYENWFSRTPDVTFGKYLFLYSCFALCFIYFTWLNVLIDGGMIMHFNVTCVHIGVHYCWAGITLRFLPLHLCLILFTMS